MKTEIEKLKLNFHWSGKSKIYPTFICHYLSYADLGLEWAGGGFCELISFQNSNNFRIKPSWFCSKRFFIVIVKSIFVEFFWSSEALSSSSRKQFWLRHQCTYLKTFYFWNRWSMSLVSIVLRVTYVHPKMLKTWVFHGEFRSERREIILREFEWESRVFRVNCIQRDKRIIISYVLRLIRVSHPMVSIVFQGSAPCNVYRLFSYAYTISGSPDNGDTRRHPTRPLEPLNRKGGLREYGGGMSMKNRPIDVYFYVHTRTYGSSLKGTTHRPC